MKLLIGLAAVFIVSISSGFGGHLIGHLLSGGEKNVGLNVALVGIICGALLTVGVLVWSARRRRDWRMVFGGIIGTAFEFGFLAWLISPR